MWKSPWLLLTHVRMMQAISIAAKYNHDTSTELVAKILAHMTRRNHKKDKQGLGSSLPKAKNPAAQKGWLKTVMSCSHGKVRGSRCVFL